MEDSFFANEKKMSHGERFIVILANFPPPGCEYIVVTLRDITVVVLSKEKKKKNLYIVKNSGDKEKLAEIC